MTKMEIKGISTLEWYLTKWLHDHDFESLKARVAADFQYSDEDKTIYFALAVPEEEDKKFLQFAQDVFAFPFDCDNFILSFFHELGHAMTWDWWIDADWDEYDEIKAAIVENNFPIEAYFGINQEYYATEWACKYIVSHQDEIEEFWRMCQKLIFNIYKQNNVEGSEN